jgi:hypothetical protein
MALSSPYIIVHVRHLDECAFPAMRANWNKVLTVVTVVARNENETAVEFGPHGMRAEALKKI